MRTERSPGSSQGSPRQRARRTTARQSPSAPFPPFVTGGSPRRIADEQARKPGLAPELAEGPVLGPPTSPEGERRKAEVFGESQRRSPERSPRRTPAPSPPFIAGGSPRRIADEQVRPPGLNPRSSERLDRFASGDKSSRPETQGALPSFAEVRRARLANVTARQVTISNLRGRERVRQGHANRQVFSRSDLRLTTGVAPCVAVVMSQGDSVAMCHFDGNSARHEKAHFGELVGELRASNPSRTPVQVVVAGGNLPEGRKQYDALLAAAIADNGCEVVGEYPTSDEQGRAPLAEIDVLYTGKPADGEDSRVFLGSHRAPISESVVIMRGRKGAYSKAEEYHI